MCDITQCSKKSQSSKIKNPECLTVQQQKTTNQNDKLK